MTLNLNAGGHLHRLAQSLQQKATPLQHLLFHKTHTRNHKKLKLFLHFFVNYNGENTSFGLVSLN